MHTPLVYIQPKHNPKTLTFLFDTLRLCTLYAFVFGTSIAGAVNRNAREWIAHQLNNLIFAGHLAAKFIWKMVCSKIIVLDIYVMFIVPKLNFVHMVIGICNKTEPKPEPKPKKKKTSTIK